MDTFVNTINCDGVMGKGIAKEFKDKFPDMFKDYSERCTRKEIVPGRPYFWKSSNPAEPSIVNFPTKKSWRNPSRIEWIEQGLEYFVNHYEDWRIKSIAFPALGCSNGKLTWIDVRKVLERFLVGLDIEVELYVPQISESEIG